MDIQVDGQLVKLECRQMEYFLLNIFMSIFYSHIPKDFMRGLGLCAPTLTSIMAHFSNVVLPERRKSQTYISSILSKNEVSRIGPYNRKLFLRTTKGFYILNPKLSLRIQGEWIPIYAVLKPQHLHFSVEGINLHQSHHESYQQHFKNTVKRCFTAG